MKKDIVRISTILLAIGSAGSIEASESSSCKMVTGYMLTSSKAQKFESRHGVSIKNESDSSFTYKIEYNHSIDRYFKDSTEKYVLLNPGDSYNIDELFTSMIKPALGNFKTLATTKIYINGNQVSNCENYGVLTVPT